MTRGRKPHDDVLTPAEWRATELVRHGLTTKATAAQLGISLYAARALARTAQGKLGLPDRMALRHWDGVRKGSARTGKGDNDMNLGHISQIARRVEDVSRAAAFWRDTLGLRELYSFPGMAFFDLDGTRLMLRQTGTRDQADILYLAVTDIAAAHVGLAAKGVTFGGAPHMIHKHSDGAEEWMAFFTDDEGRDLALHAVART